MKEFIIGAALVLTVAAAEVWQAPLPTVARPWLQEVAVLQAIPARIAAQQQQRHDQYADDKDAYCWNRSSSGSQTKQREQDTHGHECFCHLVCEYGGAGEVSGDHESGDCKLFCTRDLCKCHVESPCQEH